MTTIKLISGQELPLFEASEPTDPCTDLDLFVANVNNIIANEQLIFSDSRIFMCPIDMSCELHKSVKLKPTTLGAYLEWWLNYNEASDHDGNPLVRLTGNPLSGANSCIAASFDGTKRGIILLHDYKDTYNSFIGVTDRYNEHNGKCEAYSFEHVLQLFEEHSATYNPSDLKNTNQQMKAKLEQSRRKHIALEKLYKEKTDEYLAAILEPHIEEVKRLYRAYNEIEEYSDAAAHEHYRVKSLAYQQYRDGEITQNEYAAIRNREYENIQAIREKLQEFWLKHFTALYHQKAKYFTAKSIGRILGKK